MSSLRGAGNAVIVHYCLPLCKDCARIPGAYGAHNLAVTALKTATNAFDKPNSKSTAERRWLESRVQFREVREHLLVELLAALLLVLLFH